MAQWVAHLTRNQWSHVRCDFDHHQRLPLFPKARNLSSIAQYWFVPGMDSSMIIFGSVTSIAKPKCNCDLIELQVVRDDSFLDYNVSSVIHDTDL